MYRYETHLHTSPVSRCARSSVREMLEFYKSENYAGVFITNHFLDGNVGIDRSHPYEERIQFYFSDYEEGKRLEEEIGIRVFCGIEATHGGTDFLIYGLDKEWFLAHPESMEMKKSQFLPFCMEEGALVIQAHPFREAGYIDHIRLFPRCVQGVEIYNASRPDFENEQAEHYAKTYGLIAVAGSDNHLAAKPRYLGGLEFDTPLESEADFVTRVKGGEGKIFRYKAERTE